MSEKEESNKSQETQRMYGYFGDDSDVCTINPDEKYLDYFNELSDVHTCIDMKHDQFDQKRSNAKMRNNKDYIKSIQTAIDNISAPSGEFTTDKSYYTKSSAHTLETALERNDISSFNINKKQSPDLNPLMILPFDITNIKEVNSAGHQLEFKRFNPTKDKRVETVKVIAEDYYGDSESSPATYVLDCGPSEIYKNLNIRNEPIKSKAIFSGIMDSSSSSEYPEEIEPNYKLYVPFMRIYENKTLKGTIMMYAEPVGDGKIQVQFKYYPKGEEDYTTLPKKYDSSVVINEIPNLPEISDYLAADLHRSERVKKCIDFILKRFTKKDAIKEKCEGLKKSAGDLYKAINGKNENYEKNGDEFGKSFFMNIKHWGDRFRAIDAVILTKNDELAFTGTTDSFLMRFISLANLYGCYAHMGHNLIINDVKELSDEQQQSIKKKKRKCRS